MTVAGPEHEFDMTMAEMVVQAISQGKVTGHYQMPWNNVTTQPRNPYSGRAFSGLNAVALWNARIKRNYASDWWAQRPTWEAHGGSVRTGENGISILVPKTVQNGARKVVVGFTSEKAYNYDQVRGVHLEVAAPTPFQAVESAERILARFHDITRIPLVTGVRACYEWGPSSGERIRMPERVAFFDRNGILGAHRYYGVRFHEAVHATGHPGRLGRFSVTDTSTAYAYEELVAEGGAFFLGGEAGLPTEMREDHICYLDGWARLLNRKPDILRQAMTQAAAAARFVLDPRPMDPARVMRAARAASRRR